MSSKPKAVLISGAAQGIGRCMARTLQVEPSAQPLQKGHKVYLLDINEDELRYTVDTHLKSYHPNVGYSLCNLRSVEEIRSSVDAAAKFFGGRIDVVVNNGGIAAPYWKDNLSMDDPSTISQWQAYCDINLTAPFAVSQASIPYMATSSSSSDFAPTKSSTITEVGPCIIHIGSFRARQSDPNQEGYASMKAGLLGLTQSMAISCAQWGIRVNLVAPGRIKAGHECREADEKGEEGLTVDDENDVSVHATNRAGRPEDIADAVVYLMGAGFVTGVDLTVDGGSLVQKTKA